MRERLHAPSIWFGSVQLSSCHQEDFFYISKVRSLLCVCVCVARTITECARFLAFAVADSLSFSARHLVFI